MTLEVLDKPTLDEGRHTLRGLVESRRVLVCVGSGGVGKTTTAATLGVVGAMLGRRSLVITIDPARRLANALGLDALSHAPQRIDDSVLRAAGVNAKGELSAMMLDLKAAWDDMLFRTAPDAATAQKVLANRFYDSLSRDLPGAHEFIACEALHHLAASGEWDLVVLDTPPTSNALDFLEAPSRILAVLDNDAFRYFAQKKQSLGLRFLDGAAGRAQSVLARFAGSEVLEELGEFIVLLRDLYDPLTRRTRDFEALLRGDGTRFCVVSSPQPPALAEARFFLDELVRRELKLGALIVNRVTPSPGAARSVLAEDHWERHLEQRGLASSDAAKLAAVLDESVRQQDKLAALDLAHVEALLAQSGDAPVVRVPRLSDAVHDAKRLAELVPWLAGPMTS
jgi:anion-transporting  ArsA/GET3 family ATPase